jgi:hypothetical protein
MKKIGKKCFVLLMALSLVMSIISCDDGSSSSSSDVTTPSSTTDVTAPDTVTELTATAGDSQVSLSWTNPTDSDFSYVTISYDSTSVNSTGTSETITELTNDTEYTFSVVAYDTSGNGSTAETVSATPESTESDTVEIPTAIHDFGFTYDDLPSGTSGTIEIDDSGSASEDYSLYESGFSYGSSTTGAYITGAVSADGTTDGAIQANFTSTAYGYYNNTAISGVGVNTIDVTTDSFTIEAVVKADVITGYSSDVTLVEFYDSSAGTGWKLYVESDDASIKMKTMAGIDTTDADGDNDTTDTLSNECKTTSGIVSGQEEFYLTTDTWYHITAVYDISATDYGTYGAVFIYIDGVLIATKNANYQLAQNDETDKFIIGGGSTDANKNFEGSIDNVAIWGSALTDEQIAARAATFGF